MSQSPSFLRFVSTELRRLFDDEAFLVALLALTGLSTFVPPITDTPLRIVVGPLFVLFAPGYAFTLAVFPKSGRSVQRDEPIGLGTLERFVVSIGASIAIAGLVGLGLSNVRWSLTATSVFIAVGGITVLCLGIGGYRRRTLPPDERFVLPIRRWAAGVVNGVTSGTTGARALNLLLVVAVVASISVVIYAAESPNDAETFTELSLLDPDADDRIVADSVDALSAEGPENLTVEIESREFQRTEYTLVVALQRVSTDGNGTTITEQETLRQFTPTVDHNGTWRRTHAVTPTMSGDRLRLAYLLYRGDPPEQVTLQNAYRGVHLWVTVDPGNDTASSRRTGVGTASQLPTDPDGRR